MIPGRIAINGDGKDPRDLVIPVSEVGQAAYATLLEVFLTDDILMVNLTSQGTSHLEPPPKANNNMTFES